MRPDCVVFFDSFSQFKPHSSYAVGNEITTRILPFAEGAVAALDTTVVFRPKSWQQNFVSHLSELIQSEPKAHGKPWRVPQSVGQLRFRDDLTYFLDACTGGNFSTQTSASGDQPDGLATRVGFLIHHLT